MSRTHAEFDQFYECGDKKFVNLWQAFDYQLESQHFPYYRPDKAPGFEVNSDEDSEVEDDLPF